ncbi:MAG: helix-turn-helix domain-containing protein [Candidatus Woesearchaeota archaeon]|nr:helix-turn-helix domain-containing protein [Candidatus Woesearchaeota archaeon]
MQESEVLEQLGFTNSEARIYLALLDLGSATAGKVVAKARISGGKVYLFLDRLVKRGLVSYVVKGGIKYFQPQSPHVLLDLIAEQKSALDVCAKGVNTLLPSLNARLDATRNERRAEVYEGWKGFTTVSEWILREMKKGEIIYVFGVSKEAYKKYGHFFLYWTRKRARLGIRMRIIYSEEAREIGKTREKMPLTEVRYLPKEMESPAFINLFKEYIITYNLCGEPICFLIKDKESSEFYHKYFESVWERARL